MEDNRTPPALQDPPLSDKPASPKPRRVGKKSAQKHTDAYRRKIGQTVVAQHRKAIEDKYGMDSFTEDLKELKIEVTPVTVQVPITTRGIGFAIQEFAEQLHQPPNRPVYDINAAYRVALAQFELCLDRSAVASVGVFDSVTIVEQALRPPYEFEQPIIAHKETVRTVGAIFSSIGSFKHGSTNYCPVLAASGFTQNLDDVRRVHKRRRVEVHGMAPDPFVVTYSNLRSFVEQLADPGSPLLTRRFFAERNPIPGARFGNDFVLLNPDDIMPDGYSYRDLVRDTKTMSSFYSTAAPKLGYLLGSVDYSGEGNIACLVASEVTASIGVHGFQLENETYRADEGVSAQLIMVGAVGLLGERPDYPARTTASEYYVSRAPLVQKSVYAVERSAIMAAVQKRR